MLFLFTKKSLEFYQKSKILNKGKCPQKAFVLYSFKERGKLNIDDLKSNETDVDTNKKTLEVKKNSVYSLFEKFKQVISSKFKRKTHTESEEDFVNKTENITNSEEGIEDKKEETVYSKPGGFKKIVAFLKRKITRKKKKKLVRNREEQTKLIFIKTCSHF